MAATRDAFARSVHALLEASPTDVIARRRELLEGLGLSPQSCEVLSQPLATKLNKLAFSGSTQLQHAFAEVGSSPHAHRARSL